MSNHLKVSGTEFTIWLEPSRQLSGEQAIDCACEKQTVYSVKHSCSIQLGCAELDSRGESPMVRSHWSVWSGHCDGEATATQGFLRCLPQVRQNNIKKKKQNLWKHFNQPSFLFFKALLMFSKDIFQCSKFSVSFSITVIWCVCIPNHNTARVGVKVSLKLC